MLVVELNRRAVGENSEPRERNHRCDRGRACRRRLGDGVVGADDPDPLMITSAAYAILAAVASDTVSKVAIGALIGSL